MGENPDQKGEHLTFGRVNVAIATLCLEGRQGAIPKKNPGNLDNIFQIFTPDPYLGKMNPFFLGSYFVNFRGSTTSLSKWLFHQISIGDSSPDLCLSQVLSLKPRAERSWKKPIGHTRHRKLSVEKIRLGELFWEWLIGLELWMLMF